MAEDTERRAGLRRPGRPGWQWPVIVVALLVVGVGANVGLMVVATRDASFAVEPDYYDKALHWDERMAQEARNAALGWSVGAVLAPAARPGEARLTVRLHDRAGQAIDGARVAVQTFHSARARHVLTAMLAPEFAGQYGATLPLDRPGLWEVRLRAERGGQVFTKTLVQDLVPAP
jgi:nitrogen fixation protein FixH